MRLISRRLLHTSPRRALISQRVAGAINGLAGSASSSAAHQVVVYHLPEGAATATVLAGRYDDIEDAQDNSGKVAVAFIEERTEATDQDH